MTSTDNINRVRVADVVRRYRCCKKFWRREDEDVGVQCIPPSDSAELFQAACLIKGCMILTIISCMHAKWYMQQHCMHAAIDVQSMCKFCAHVEWLICQQRSPGERVTVSARSKEYHRQYCGTIYQEEVFFLERKPGGSVRTWKEVDAHSRGLLCPDRCGSDWLPPGSSLRMGRANSAQ
jgi:hypothetical protein